ncbi:type 1 glutamine amidotransferase family protein [Spongiimicrobium sp. 2-473A-2-J]|uniref:type 1 glutamine amidotransferase family protein n=1 Tax=Eudoraea algarum TaxID=3417568 RepID=UPI003D35E583
MKTANVYILLFDGFSDWEIAYLTPELNKSEKSTVKFFTVHAPEVTSMGGLRVRSDLLLEQLGIEAVSALVLPGGTAWEKNEIVGIDALVERLNAANKTIAAICAATTFLGQRGYLDHIGHTSNDLNYLKAAAPHYQGEKKYKNIPAITDGNIISANGTAPQEFARELFIKLNIYDQKEAEKWFQLFKHGIWTEE